MSFAKKSPCTKICPKTGKPVSTPWWLHHGYRWLLPITGLMALVWFLIRVIPKPSRATYPCQRVAASLAAGFVVWVTGIVASTLAYRKAMVKLRRQRYSAALLLLAMGVTAIWIPLSLTLDFDSQAAFIPSDGPNQPLGIGQGLHPGRVVWVHDPEATSWDGSQGHWWDDENTHAGVVDQMLSAALHTLTGESDDATAWDALFRQFKRSRNLEETGFKTGETVVIKINMNQNGNTAAWGKGRGMPSPQMIYSLVSQLIETAGIPGRALTIYDASRYIGDTIVDRIRANPAPDFQAVEFVVHPDLAGRGRRAAQHDPDHPVTFADQRISNGARAYLPRCVTQADYLINMALFRPHSLFGITLCGKNHFGSTYFAGNGWTPSPLHNYGQRSNAMGTYNCLVDLIGHTHLGGKTLLYLVDGLYGAQDQSNNVMRFLSFGDDWTSSLFVSQDPVAIDSVGLDFLRAEARATQVTGRGVDNYLHEAALADQPPSGTVYDPESDGHGLTSLGVHEHWNNPTDKQYSRNLGTGQGIELVRPSWEDPNGPVENVTQAIRYQTIRHALEAAQGGDTIVIQAGLYHETIDFKGRDLRIQSVNPNDLEIVRSTVIQGGQQGVVFSGGESDACVLAGLTIQGAVVGITCTNASPLVSHCIIADHHRNGIRLIEASSPTLMNCLIQGNQEAGIDMRKEVEGRRSAPKKEPFIGFCTILGNSQGALLGGTPVVTNSILYDNGILQDGVQISEAEATVTYCNVQGGIVGKGNVDQDPGCVVQGYWGQNAEGNLAWVSGDCHLENASPCVNAGDPDTPLDPEKTDLDGHARRIGDRVDMGCDERVLP